MMERLRKLLSGETPPGLYRVPAATRPETVQRLAEQHGWRFFYVDGAAVSDKCSFIRTAGDALHFPAYSAQNWDAFEESIRDLTWAPAAGRQAVVLFDEPDQFATRDPGQWAVARSILQEAVDFWRAQGAPLAVLFRKAGRALPDVPKLP